MVELGLGFFFFLMVKFIKVYLSNKPQYLSVVSIQNNSFRVLCRQSLRSHCMLFEPVMPECLRRVLFPVN